MSKNGSHFLIVIIAHAGVVMNVTSVAAAEPGRIVVPAQSSSKQTAPGLHKLDGGKGYLYLPSNYRPNQPLPLLVLLHKAGGGASEWFAGGHPNAPGSYASYADAGHFIILAPEAPGQSWGTGPKSWGYEYMAINRALEGAFAQCVIDRNRLAIGGFSDGASYALSLGLANGDLFGHVIAFSPGFIVRAMGRGRPSLFIAHGLSDNVLPITTTSRIFVDSLRKNGYNVVFREFGGGHHISSPIVDEAMKWLTNGYRSGR